jgi:hypothetical protein
MAMGSGNGLASNLKIPKNLNKALLLLKNQNVKKIDVGRLNDNYFFSNAGVGIAANVVRHYENSKKRKLWSYINASIKSLRELKIEIPIKVTTDNQTLSVNSLMLFISNTNELGYNVSLTPKASLQDGLLDIILVSKTKAGADPEGSGVEKFLARGGRKLERGIERPAHVEERVSDDPGVGDSHAKSARVQNGPGTINLQHGLCSCGGE